MPDDVARSLSAEDRLRAYLPELLVDLTSLGFSPQPLLRMLERSVLGPRRDVRILDLGCGKGAALIELARAFGWRGRGVDLVPEFIAAARQRARELGVQDRLSFEVRDLRAEAQVGDAVELILFGVDHEIWDSLQATLCAISKRLDRSGYVALDLVWRRSDEVAADVAPDEAAVERAIADAAFTVIDREVLDSRWVREQNEGNTARIRERARQLALREPALATALEEYVRAQERESRALEEELVCAWLLLQPSAARIS